MKKLIPYILALITFMACTAEPQERTGMDPSLEGKPVTITFSLPDVRVASLSTKSIQDEGDITGEPYLDPERLYLVVCGTNQSIKYIRKAKWIETNTDFRRASITDYPISDPDAPLPEKITLYTFEVQLELSDSKRTVHFLGNVDEDQLITGSFASQVLPSLLSYDLKQAYWQRVFLKEIHPKVNETTQQPEMNENGTYVPDDYVKERLQYVPLIRNYAKIQVTNAADKEDLDPQSRFHLDSYAVIHYPTRGSVVPYRTNAGQNEDPFSFNVSQENRLSGYESCDFLTLDEEVNYPGNLPSIVSMDEDIPTESMFENPGTSGGKVLAYEKGSDKGFYIFERGIPTATILPTYVIIRGCFGDPEDPNNTHYYYRLDLMETQQVADESLSQYYPIYRNFRYDIQLNRISSEGLLSPRAAANSSMVVDISADVSMRHLSDISNGRTRMVVEPFMTRTYTGPSKEGYYTLYTRFFNDINSANPNKDPGSVTVELVPMDGDEEDILILYDDNDNPVVHGGKFYPKAQWLDDVNGNGVEDEDEGGYRVIHFNTKDKKFDVTKTQKIKITGRNLYSTFGELPLYREVEIALQQRQEMTVVCDPDLVPLQNEAPMALKITIPSGLPTSMFPLNFIIEAEAKTLTPDNDNLPVRSGISLSDNPLYEGKPTIQFIRTLTLEEYEKKSSGSSCTFYSYFKSNRIQSATTIWVEDENKYFNKKSASFTNLEVLPGEHFYVEADDEATCYVRFSLDNLWYKMVGGEWTSYTNNTVLTLGPTQKRVYFRSTKNTTYRTGVFKCSSKSDMSTTDGKFHIGGNLASLLVGDDFDTQGPSYSKTYSFIDFLKNHTGLSDASDLVIPMLTCKENCFKSMFEGCKALLYGPVELPATTMANYCYRNMFRNCEKLVVAPILPATTINTNCYQMMFYGCSSLTEIKLNSTSYQTGNFISSNATDKNSPSKFWAYGVPSNGTIWLNPKIKEQYLSDYMKVIPTGEKDGQPWMWTVKEYPANKNWADSENWTW